MPRCLFILIFCGGLFWGGLPAGAAPAKPVSVSYEDLVHCFPELASQKMASRVDLDVLKDLVDEKFVSTESWLRYRKIRYAKESGEVQILTQALTSRKPQTYELRLEKWDPKEGAREIPLPSQARRINPTQKQIEQFLLENTVQSDESAYEASKARGLEMSTVKGLQGIQHLELRDSARKRSISCDQEKDLGVICTCSKK